MSSKANKRVVREWFAETIGKVDVDMMLQRMESVFAPDFVDHDGPDPANGLAALKHALPMLLKGVDVTFTVEQLLAEDDLVAVRLRGDAKLRRTGQPLSWTENEIFRFENGRIAESWGEGTLEEALSKAGLSFRTLH